MGSHCCALLSSVCNWNLFLCLYPVDVYDITSEIFKLCLCSQLFWIQIWDFKTVRLSSLGGIQQVRKEEHFLAVKDIIHTFFSFQGDLHLSDKTLLQCLLSVLTRDCRIELTVKLTGIFLILAKCKKGSFI